MIARLAGLWPRSIAMQMAWVALAAAVLINVVGEITQNLVAEPLERRLAIGTSTDAPRIVADLVRASNSLQQQEAILAAAAGIGISIRRLERFEHSAAGEEIVLRDGSSTVAVGPADGNPVFGSLTAANYTIVGVAIFSLLTMTYALCAIVAPLSRFARVARAFGQTEEGDAPLAEAGSLEIRAVARALNEMRERIRGLIDARTRMLRAISHDLRTPLTRLRLRIERLPEDDTTRATLRDLDHISRMIDNTLTYLRDGETAGVEVVADLPSLLQTACADFADLGHNVGYEGPQRLRVACRPADLTRAVSNLIENGVRFGQTVVVRLDKADERTVRIDVSDDGPGIPAGQRRQVVEPFFRADESRRGALGFGLGLAIVEEIVSSHGGTLQLLTNQPHGLTARITLAS